MSARPSMSVRREVLAVCNIKCTDVASMLSRCYFFPPITPPPPRCVN